MLERRTGFEPASIPSRQVCSSIELPAPFLLPLGAHKRPRVSNIRPSRAGDGWWLSSFSNQKSSRGILRGLTLLGDGVAGDRGSGGGKAFPFKTSISPVSCIYSLYFIRGPSYNKPSP